MIFQMDSCHSTAPAMETVQYVFESAAPVVLGVWRSIKIVLYLLVIFVKELMWLILVCVGWWLFFYKLYHRIELYCRRRHCKARHTKLLNGHMKHSEEEKAAISLHWPLGHSSQERQALETVASGGVSGENLVLVPVTLFCRCTLRCDVITCKRKLKKSASKVHAPCQTVKCLERDKGQYVAVQTQVQLNAETADTLTRIAARKLCGEVTVQLGRWRACCLVDGEVKPMDIDECDSSDKNNRVPVLFNASFKADTLTVEGLNLANASINIVTKGGDCSPLKTECNGDVETGVAVSTGVGDLEIHTFMPKPPKEEGWASIGEFSVIAFKEVIKDGYEVRVSSLPVQIQDNRLRIGLRYLLPPTVIFFFAFKQIWSSVGFATLVVASLLSYLTVPESAEEMSKEVLEKMKAFVILIYDVYLTWQYYSEGNVDDSAAEEADYDSELDDVVRLEANKGKAAEETDEDQSWSVYAKAEVQAKSYFSGSSFVHSADWQWPIYDTVHMGGESHLQLRKERKDEEEDPKKIPFEVIYLNIKYLPWASQVEVKIYSRLLISFLPTDTDRWKSCKKKVIVDGPELFRNYTTLRTQRDSWVAKLESSELAPDARLEIRDELSHIKHLVRFLDEEFEDIAPTYEAMKTDRQVTWDMLWAFLPPGERVVYVDEVTDECVCGKVLWTKYQQRESGELVLLVKVTKWDYNCQSWNEYANKVTVPAFSGDCEIKDLRIRPFRFEKDPDATETSFLDHGKRFCELSMLESKCYMEYKGSLVSYIWVDKCMRIVKENANGRVMIDLCSFSKMNPDFPLDSAKPPCEIIRDNIPIKVDVTRNPERMFAPSFVYGFSFRLKKWGCFSVAGFTDIEFNDSAWNELVMNSAMKELTLSLVQERLKEGSKKEGPLAQAVSDRVDPIANKGDGCILLCYGPPGTGKTLTAESLSEILQCPLWCLSVFELGVTPAELETMLVKVLDIAASWGAILLLDEADVYLERRSSKDLVRNSMTGVFLRHLEYYRGVLFLTTNRDAAFDEAICSRITMFLHYGRHNEHQRSAIWKSLFDRLGLEACTEEILAEFSKPDFNGREITKIVKTAQTLARSKGQELEFQHVRHALEVYHEASKLRASLNSSAGASTLPLAHQQPTKQHPERFIGSAPPELPSCSTVIRVDVVQEERPPQSSLLGNIHPENAEETHTLESSGDETSTSDHGTNIETVTPTSETYNKTIETGSRASGRCNGAIGIETPTSKCNEIIEVVTPVSPDNNINHVPMLAHSFYRR